MYWTGPRQPVSQQKNGSVRFERGLRGRVACYLLSAAHSRKLFRANVPDSLEANVPALCSINENQMIKDRSWRKSRRADLWERPGHSDWCTERRRQFRGVIEAV
nr:uncharacterized protein LOC117160157 [Bombus vancouverensis nearcticus]